MAIYLTTIAAANYLSQFPKALVFKTLGSLYENAGVTTMIDSDDDKVNESQTPTSVGPYDFLNRLAELNASVGIKTQTELANELGKVEGVVRGSVKAIAKAVPIERLKEDGRGKLTELGIALVTACINREDMTLEAWVHGLMEAMKSPEYKSVRGETFTAEDIDLGFLDKKIENDKTETTDLALSSQGELAALIRKRRELESKSTEVSQQEKDRLYQAAYKRRIALKLEELKADIKAQQDIEEALANGDLFTDF